MSPRFLTLVLVLCASSVLVPAGAIGDDAKKTPPDGPAPGAVEVRFTDGGFMRMAIAEEHLELTTAHGKLKIAVADVRRLDLATRISEEDARLIKQSVEDLGSSEFAKREKATAALLALKEKAYPAVLKASRTKDTEIVTRTREILDKIRGSVPAHRLNFKEKDVVYTSDSTITGKIELNSLNVTTQQFGKVQLKFTDVASLYFLATGGETELKLDGRYALQTEVWLDTGLDVSEHGRLTITATGEIDMYATGGYVGQYVGTPKGKKAWPGNTGLPYEPGTLVGRIGENGKVFVVKDQFDEAASASGRLYLRAAGNPYSVQTTGHYTIKIQGGVPAAGAATRTEVAPDQQQEKPIEKQGRKFRRDEP